MKTWAWPGDEARLCSGGDFLSDVHFADLVYFGSAHSTYCACANAMCFLRVFGGNYSICLYIMEGSLFYRQSCFLFYCWSCPGVILLYSFSVQSGRSLILDPGVSTSILVLFSTIQPARPWAPLESTTTMS